MNTLREKLRFNFNKFTAFINYMYLDFLINKMCPVIYVVEKIGRFIVMVEISRAINKNQK